VQADDGRRIEIPRLFEDDERARDFAKIRVRDTGIGLKSEHLEKVFRSFEQVESSHNRKYAGTGLGLALTRNFVELHGGSIWAESQGEGKGSTFSFVIPIAQKQLSQQQGDS
jgi:signal transduction histidine kinase